MSLNAYAIKKAAFVFGVEDFNHVRTDPKMRLTASPFTHDAENTVFIGSAAPWKGKKGASFWNDPSANKKGGKGTKGKSVVDGLKEAIRISKACAGEKGSVSVGDRRLPTKVVCQMQKAKKTETAD